MSFTFSGYRELLGSLKKHFKFSTFDDYHTKGFIYLRHDIDIFIENCLILGEIESELGIKATYMFMTSGEFYNLLSRSSIKIIEKLHEMGHVISLHIDLPVSNKLSLVSYIKETHEYFKNFLPLSPIVSFHRPNVKELENLEIPGFVNVYHRKFFKDIRYFSDSKMRNFLSQLENSLKEDPETSIHLLIHPFWWDHVEYNVLTAFDRYLYIKNQFLRRALRIELNLYRQIMDGRFFGNIEEGSNE